MSEIVKELNNFADELAVENKISRFEALKLTFRRFDKPKKTIAAISRYLEQ